MCFNVLQLKHCVPNLTEMPFIKPIKPQNLSYVNLLDGDEKIDCKS